MRSTTDNPYLDAVGGSEPRLLDSYLVFMDALGSKEGVSGDEAAIQRRFTRFRRAWDRASEIAGLWDKSWVAAVTFSDLVVAALPIKDDGEGELASILTTTSLFQFFLALEGIFVRGALVRGLAWVDDSPLAYGPALVEAYELERKAHYPRVILSDGVCSAIKGYMMHYGDHVELTPENDNLLVDSDKTFFVDYLARLFTTDGDVAPIREGLEQHRLAVGAGLFDARFDSRATDKLLWVARYHNYFVTTYIDNEAQANLLVGDRHPSLNYFQLSEYWGPDGPQTEPTTSG